MHALSSMENSLFQAMVDRKLGGKGNGKLCVERELKRRRRRSRSKSREKRELQVSVRPLECVWYCGSCCGCGLKKVVL